MTYYSFFETHLRKFRVRGNGQAQACCPLHDDRQPSFSCNVESGVWTCHGCNRNGNAHQLAELLGVEPPDESGSKVSEGSLRRTEVARYTYQDKFGQDYLQVRRYSPKSFLQFRYENGEWKPGLKGRPPILYHLPEVLSASVVYVVEGEKDVETLRSWGLIATTNPGGALKWRPEFSQVLRDKSVVVLPDTDDKGREHANLVIRSLWNQAKEIKSVILPQGKDVTKWKGLGGTKERLIELVKQTEVLRRPPEDNQFSQPNNNKKPHAKDAQPVLIPLSEVEPEEISWLWPDRIALGKLTLLIGDPGLGKSFATMDMTSRISKGLAWPDGSQCPLGKVVLLNAEDGLADTLRPRLDTQGGDPTQVTALNAILQEDDERPFCLETDLKILGQVLETQRPSLVVIDPLSAYLGKTNSYKDSEVRGILAPLAKMADKYNTAVLAIMHLNKNSQKSPLYRTAGSIGFVGAARMVLALTKHPEDEEKRLIAPIKTNLARLAPALSFQIVDGVLHWDPEPMDLDVSALLSASTNPEEKHEIHEADEFLQSILEGGREKSTNILKAARAHGISDRTLKRAKSRLRVKSNREGGISGQGTWYWSLPKEATKSANIEAVAPLEQPLEKTHEISIPSPKDAKLSTMAPLGGTLRESLPPLEEINLAQLTTGEVLHEI